MTRSKQTLLLAMTAALVGLAPGAVQAADSPAGETKKIVFVHGKASHGYGGHAYGPAFRYLARIQIEAMNP
jgi:ABC-type sugar transport system substrate-binding protein